MAQKRPRSSSVGTAVLSDDSIDVIVAAKRQHVEQQSRLPQHRPANTAESNNRLVHVTPEQLSGDNTAATKDDSIDHSMEVPPLQPQPPASQRLSSASALLFRPRQLQTVTASTATSTLHQQHKPTAVTPAVHQLPVLKTIDWRSTDEADSSGGMDDDSQLDEEEEADKGGEEQLEEGDDRTGAECSSGPDMELELDLVVSRIRSLVLPRRITFGRRQPMPIVRPARLPSDGSPHTS